MKLHTMKHLASLQLTKTVTFLHYILNTPRIMLHVITLSHSRIWDSSHFHLTEIDSDACHWTGRGRWGRVWKWKVKKYVCKCLLDTISIKTSINMSIYSSKVLQTY